MVRQNPCRNSTNRMTAAATIDEAQRIARKVVEAEKGKCGGHVPTALYRASSLYGVEETSLRALWERRARKFVKAHVLDRLREIDAYLEAKATQEIQALRETARVLEERGHPAAGLARRAAEMAGADQEDMKP